MCCDSQVTNLGCSRLGNTFYLTWHMVFIPSQSWVWDWMCWLAVSFEHRGISPFYTTSIPSSNLHKPGECSYVRLVGIYLQITSHHITSQASSSTHPVQICASCISPRHLVPVEAIPAPSSSWPLWCPARPSISISQRTGSSLFAPSDNSNNGQDTHIYICIYIYIPFRPFTSGIMTHYHIITCMNACIHPYIYIYYHILSHIIT